MEENEATGHVQEMTSPSGRVVEGDIFCPCFLWGLNLALIFGPIIGEGV